RGLAGWHLLRRRGQRRRALRSPTRERAQARRRHHSQLRRARSCQRALRTLSNRRQRRSQRPALAPAAHSVARRSLRQRPPIERGAASRRESRRISPPPIMTTPSDLLTARGANRDVLRRHFRQGASTSNRSGESHLSVPPESPRPPLPRPPLAGAADLRGPHIPMQTARSRPRAHCILLVLSVGLRPLLACGSRPPLPLPPAGARPGPRGF